MSPTCVEKLKGHTEHLLDLFIGLKGKYALLAPITFDNVLLARYATGAASDGLVILRNALAFSCIQDMAKLTFDKAPRAPSIRNLVDNLADSEVRSELEDAYSLWGSHAGGDHPPEVAAVLEAEEQERRTQFQNQCADLEIAWANLQNSEALQACLKMRNKVVAHTDVHHAEGEYCVLDVSELGLKWGELGTAVQSIGATVDLITQIARGAHFDFEMLEEQVVNAAAEFWGATD